MTGTPKSGDINIKAPPDIAENGLWYRLTISTNIAGAESIAVVAINNPAPLIASYNLGGARALYPLESRWEKRRRDRGGQIRR